MICREWEFANKNETTTVQSPFLPSPLSAVIASRRLKSQWASGQWAFITSTHTEGQNM